MTDMNPNSDTVAPTSPTPDAPKAPETPTPTPERGGNGGLFSLGLGAVVAAVILSGYSLVALIGGIITSAAPYLAGAALFVTLMTVFLSIITMLKKFRRSAQKTFAIWDCYTAMAVISVLGFFAAACVATFQPGADPSTLWSYGVGTASLFGMLFGGGKWAGQLFNEGSTNKSKSN